MSAAIRISEIVREKNRNPRRQFGNAIVISSADRARGLGTSPPSEDITLLTGIYVSHAAEHVGRHLRSAAHIDLDMHDKHFKETFVQQAKDGQWTIADAMSHCAEFKQVVDNTRAIVRAFEAKGLETLTFFTGRKGFRILARVPDHLVPSVHASSSSDVQVQPPHLFAVVFPDTSYGREIAGTVLGPVLGPDLVRPTVIDHSVYNPDGGVKHDLVPHHATQLWPVRVDLAKLDEIRLASDVEDKALSDDIRAYWIARSEHAAALFARHLFGIPNLDHLPRQRRPARGGRNRKRQGPAEPLHLFPTPDARHRRDEATHFSLKGEMTSYRKVDNDNVLWDRIARHVARPGAPPHFSNEIATPVRPFYLELDAFPDDLVALKYEPILAFARYMATDLFASPLAPSSSSAPDPCVFVATCPPKSTRDNAYYYHIVFRDILVESPLVHRKLLQVFSDWYAARLGGGGGGGGGDDAKWPNGDDPVDRNVEKLRMVSADKWDPRRKEAQGRVYTVVSRLVLDPRDLTCIRIDDLGGQDNYPLADALRDMSIRRRRAMPGTDAAKWTQLVHQVDVQDTGGGGGGGLGANVRIDVPPLLLERMTETLRGLGHEFQGNVTRATLLAPREPNGNRKRARGSDTARMGRTIILSTDQHACPTAGREHRHATLSFVVHDDEHRAVKQKCFSSREPPQGGGPCRDQVLTLAHNLPRDQLEELFGDDNIEPNAVVTIAAGREEAERINEARRRDAIIRLNERYVHTQINGKIRIIDVEYRDGQGQRKLVEYTIPDFLEYVRRREYYDVLHAVDNEDNNEEADTRFTVHTEPAGPLWLASDHGAQAEGSFFFPHLTIDPPPLCAELEKTHFNLWRGPPIEASADAGSMDLFFELLLDVMCNGDEEKCDYLLKQLATVVQYPHRKSGVAIVFAGPQGAGKGTVMHLLERIFGSAYVATADIQHICGKFNAVLQDKVVVFADEAMFAGDPKVQGKVKKLITDDVLTIEKKGIDSFTARNCVHLFMATNEKWAAALERDDRRYIVFNVARNGIKDQTFYARVHDELRNGGAERILYELLYNVDLTGFVPSYIPPFMQPDRITQKLQSLSREESFVYAVLDTGIVNAGPEQNHGVDDTWEWPDMEHDGEALLRELYAEHRVEPIALQMLYKAYVRYCRQVHPMTRRPCLAIGIFATFMRDVLGKDRVDSYRGHRHRIRERWYFFPPLATARKIFAARLGAHDDETAAILWNH